MIFVTGLIAIIMTAYRQNSMYCTESLSINNAITLRGININILKLKRN